MIRFDVEHNIEDYTIVLSKKNYQHIGQIRNVSELISKINMNAANEISFTVYKYNNYEDKEIEPLWDEIVDFKYIYVVELDEYYEINVELIDGESIYKTVTGTSACEVELSQTYIYGLEINTESDIAREDYKNPTIFYNPENPDESLLNRALYKVPHYSIKHVDSSLVKIQRTFSADREDVYSFLTGTVATEINCLFVFDSVERGIYVYDLDTVCLDCGYRGEFSDECPECHSKNLKYYGEDTTIYVDTENLAEEVSFVVDTDSVKNCFRLEAGDDNMTAAVTNLNPNGSSYIYYFSADQKHDMSDDLVQKMDDYDKLYDSYTEEYKTVMKNMYEAIDQIVYYTSSMMPTRENEPTDAEKEAAKLTEQVLSPIGLPTVTSSTSVATVNSALKNYSKIYIHSGKYKVDIDSGEFVYEGTDEQGYNFGSWYGSIRLTNYGDDEDTATTPPMKIKVYDNYHDFLEQKIKKKLAEDKEEQGDVFDVLSIEDLEQFKQALTLYCLNRLISFNDAIQSVIDIMIEVDQAKEGADFYEEFYVPYYNKLQACQAEIDKREATIDGYKAILETAEKRQIEIQDILNFEKYLGDKLYKEFCCHRREDTYSNDNYVSDGLTNDELFKRAEEFIDVAKKELIKSGEYQHSISSTLNNLLAMKEFEPLKDKFALGNFIRIGVVGIVYRLRLISYQITFENIQQIDVEFSDITKTKDGTTDLESILNQASSMASSYGAVVHQVEKSKESDDLVKQWVEEGLDLSNIKIISNADNQDVVYNKNGILIRTYDDISETYGDEQMRLVNSTIALTDDNWKTIKTAVGRYYYKDPETGEEKKAYGVLAETLVGKLILGEELGIYSQDANASMTFDNRGLILNAKKGADGQYPKILDVQIDGQSKLYIDRDGSIVVHNGEIDAVTDELEKVIERTSKLELSVSGIQTEVSKKVGDDEIISSINQSAEEIRIQADKIKFEGLVTANDNFKILEDGSIEANNGMFTGTINSNNGTIGGLHVSEDGIYMEVDYNFVELGEVKPSKLRFNIGSKLTSSENYTDAIISWTVSDDTYEYRWGYITPDTIWAYNVNSIAVETDSVIATSGVYVQNRESGLRLANGSTIADTNIPYFALRGANDVWFGSNGTNTSQMIIHANSFDTWGSFKVNGDFTVAGNKNRVVQTENYGNVLMNAVESADCLFEDNGSGLINNEGICIIFFDSIFAETVNLNCEYYIQLTKYGQGDIYIAEKHNNYFVVKGTVGLGFDWNVKAKQKGYETDRMKVGEGYIAPTGGAEMINSEVLNEQLLREQNALKELSIFNKN